MGNVATSWTALVMQSMREDRRQVRHQAALKSWVTRRANTRRRDYQARGIKSWITRRANIYFGTVDQSSVTRRLNELY